MVKLKKAQGGLEVNETVLLVVAIIVLISAFVFISGIGDRIVSWVRGLPSFAPQNNSFKELTGDEARILGYEPVGKVQIISQTINGQDWIPLGAWNVLIFNPQLIEQKDCKTPNIWKTVACADIFGIISENPKDSKCAQYATYLNLAGCFDAEGRLLYKSSYAATGIYVDWKSGDASGAVNGDLLLHKPGNLLKFDAGGNFKIGTFTNDFIQLSTGAYNQYATLLQARGITQDLFNKLDSAKYINGWLYKKKSAPTIPINNFVPASLQTLIPETSTSPVSIA